MKNQSKKTLRKKMKKMWQIIPVEEIEALSREVMANFLSLDKVKEAESFFIYVSLDDEVQTHDLIKALLKKGKVVTVPKIIAEGLMDAYQITDWHQLKPGKYNIPEPVIKYPYKGKIDICIAPSVAITEKRHRLGRGRGYYDRFLAKHPDVFVVALAFNQQIVDKIPFEQTDKLVNVIVTENRIIS
jgi:5-formyltetrahydrofolate cyclo-ligase